MLESVHYFLNPKMDMLKIVRLDGFGVRANPGKHFVLKKRNPALHKTFVGPRPLY